MSDEPGFKLTFDGKPSKQYPHGYWYAATNDGNYDAVGSTIENVLSNLIIVLHTELTDKYR